MLRRRIFERWRSAYEPTVRGIRQLLSKICQTCFTPFNITTAHLSFLDRLSPGVGGKHFALPAPDSCAACRQRLRLSFRNERFLYRRQCGLCGRSIVSVYSPDKPFTILCPDCWWGDTWDAVELGDEIRFDQTLATQLDALQLRVPKMGAFIINSVNCAYNVSLIDSKNCYMLRSARAEDSMYGRKLVDCRNVIDGIFVENSELCYDISWSKNCYNCCYIERCVNCRDSRFLFGCTGCSCCFLCSNLTNQSFCILNTRYSETQYRDILSKIDLGRSSVLAGYKLEFAKIKQAAVKRATWNINCEDCSGDNLSNCKNCIDCYEVSGAQDCMFFSDSINGPKDCLDCDIASLSPELGYNCISGVNAYRNLSCFNSHYCSNLAFCLDCQQCKDCFACAGLKHKQFCILNRQCTEREYHDLLFKIIEKIAIPRAALSTTPAHVGSFVRGRTSEMEWGCFFPAALSAFGYNETLAQEHFPLTREQALSLGFNWSDYESETPTAARILKASDLPDAVSETTEEILDCAIECQSTNRLFKIIKPELDFYRTHQIPLPRLHPNERYDQRHRTFNPRRLWQRPCARCAGLVDTSYAPDRPDTVLCEGCYQQEFFC